MGSFHIAAQIPNHSTHKVDSSGVEDRIVHEGKTYVPESLYTALVEEHTHLLEQLAEERIMLNPTLHQVQKDRLELKKLVRDLRGDIKRSLWNLSPTIKQELRMTFYERHHRETNVKQRFDDAIARPKPPRKPAW